MTRPDGPRMDARKPALIVVVGAVLALIALLVPPLDVSGAGSSTLPPEAAAQPPASSPATPPCSPIKDSLRPQGPLPTPGAMPAGSTMAKIAARGRLIAGVDQGKFLLGYRNPDTGELQGADIDVARSIAAAIFGDPDRIQYVVVPIADRQKLVESGEVDVVVNSFTITCPRQQKIEFSTPYFVSFQRALVPAGSGVDEVSELRGQKVCTSKGATSEGALRDLNAGLDVVTETAIQDCMVALQQGRVAAVSIDDAILAGLAQQDPQTRIVGRSYGNPQSYGIGMKQSSPDLVRFVNAILERDRANGALAASEQRWLGRQLDPIPAIPPASYRD